jgi:toxin ParE1/3/4
MKPLLRRARADRNVAEAIDYYRAASPKTALGFVDDLERAFRHVQRHPASGSPRYGYELNLPGLRAWPCKRHPYLVFYLETTERIEMWRVLHGSRDIPAWLGEG